MKKGYFYMMGKYCLYLVCLFLPLPVLAAPAVEEWEEWGDVDGISYCFYLEDKIAHVIHSLGDREGVVLPAVRDMEEVVIPETVTYKDEVYTVTAIDNVAFSRALKMVSITIPKTVTRIPVGVFDCCKELVSIKVDPENPVYDSREDCNAIIETKSNTLMGGCKASVIPSSVTHIGERAFSRINFSSLTIPANVVSFDGAFISCEIPSLTIEEGVKSIGERAFAGAVHLETVYLPHSVDTIGSQAFINCYSLTSVTTDARVIKDIAFRDCPNLKKVILNEGVKVIGDNCFTNVSKDLRSISLPSTLDSLGIQPFEQWIDTVFIHATTPPACNYWTWATRGPYYDYVSFDETLLYVPKGCADTYRAMPTWNWFMDIREMDSTVGISSVANPYDNGCETYYDLQGRQLPGKPKKGLYIVNGKKKAVF